MKRLLLFIVGIFIFLALNLLIIALFSGGIALKVISVIAIILLVKYFDLITRNIKRFESWVKS